MKAGRALWTWVAACAAGAGLVLLAAGRDWVTVTYGARAVPVSAAELAPALGPAAWAALAAVVAVLATRGLWRRIVGVAMALCGAGVIAAAVSGGRPDAGLAIAAEHAPMAAKATDVVQIAAPLVWPVLAGAGGLLLLAGGVVAALRGGRWPGMSERYDRQGPGREGAARASAGGAQTDRELWDAIDLGADPTADPEGEIPAAPRENREKGGGGR
ncbi:Trp biosynthesis-associated membrane protein [Streptosporangium sp. NPDC051023]|uniref:Trp biosynthesis-associated membrane protein n=1 Tax=Streptosporangium sp. NPDC051023 TaxID=3155410 RepID=UPI003450197C